VKLMEHKSGLNASIEVDTVRAVIRDGKLENLPPDPNSQLTRGRMYWTFTSGHFAGKEVLPTLRDYYADLKDNVLPTAERLLN
jgi:hypothetical protein